MSAGSQVERRIFVVGVPRSGTTLVQSLLAAHPALTSFTESHLIDRHFSRLPLLSTPLLTRDPSRRLREFLSENGDPAAGSAAGLEPEWPSILRAKPLLPFQTRTIARRLLRVLDGLSLRRGRKGWIEKTPRHLRYVPFLEAVSAPEAPTHFVHVIREGLEVVASLREASKSWERPYDLDACVRRWNDDVGFSLGRIGEPNDHFVFYEELTSHTEGTLRRLVEQLGLEWESGLLERHRANARRLVTGEETWKTGIDRPIIRSGTSRSALNAEERDRAQRGLCSELYERIRERVTR